MKKTMMLVLIGLIFNSCATILNSRTESIAIQTSEPAKIKISNDIYGSDFTSHWVTVERSRDPLQVLAYSEQKSKTVNIKSRNSVAYWLNLYPYFLPGFLVDMNNPKRYSYPKNIYIDMSDDSNGYKRYRLDSSSVCKYTNIFKVTTLKPISLYNSGIEVAYEKKTSNKFSTQVSAAYLFSGNSDWLEEDIKPGIKGFQVGVEERLYLRKSAPNGPYVGFELNHLRNKYRAEGWYDASDLRSDDEFYHVYADSISISKKTYSFNFKIGYQLIRKRLSIDFYTGLGARYKNIVHSDRLNPEDELASDMHPFGYWFSNRAGKYWTVSIPFNVRIGWAF